MDNYFKPIRVGKGNFSKHNGIQVNIRIPFFNLTPIYKRWSTHMHKYFSDNPTHDFRIINGIFNKKVSFQFADETSMFAMKSEVINMVIQSTIYTNNMLEKEYNLKVRQSRSSKIKSRNIRLLNRHFDNITSDAKFLKNQEITDEPIILVDLGNRYRNKLVPISDLNDHLFNHPTSKLHLNLHNWRYTRLIRQQLEVHSLAPFWATDRGYKHLNSDYLSLTMKPIKETDNHTNQDYKIVFEDNIELYRITDPSGEYLADTFETKVKAEAFLKKLKYENGRTIIGD